ncbi:alpha/beta hydrolase [Granulicella sp. dw_53]|uniref:alpha/beta hydrolase family protein n=1 Tax=Granulicella sp. dw_53 TaxID=2719792 RepID=UPI001BD6167F|nr:alpha/beta hydrolase [Granulicella sp. dw_53]
MCHKLAVAFTLLTLTIPSLQAQTTTPTPQSPQSATPEKPLVFEEAAKSAAVEPPKENWTTISLAKSGLPTQSVAGVPMSKSELPEGCTRELLRLEWRQADPIDLYVIRPTGVENPPVGLFLLNYTFDTNIFRTDYWCSQSKQNGLAIVGFGSALSWQRFHTPRPMREWFVSELQEALSTSAHDVQMVLNYLETRKDLDMKHVGMYGQGSGGAIAILAAAADSRISAIDVTDPWGDWPEWLKGSKQIPEEERAAYLKPEFLQKVANLDPVNYLPQLEGKSIRIQQVTDDPVTPSAAKEKIAGAAPRTIDVVHYPDKEAQHKSVFLGGITEWLANQLHPRTVMASEFDSAK